VLFAVERVNGNSEIQIKPVVLLERAGPGAGALRYVAPPYAANTPAGAAEGNAALLTANPKLARFVNAYLRPGRMYRLLFGGGAAGRVTVSSPPRNVEIALDTPVKTETTIRLGGQVMTLATSASPLPARWQKPGTRRGASASERTSAVALAHAYLRRKRVPAADLQRLRVVNLTAVDMDGDLRSELIGTFEVPRRAATNINAPNHVLFLVAEPDAAARGATYQSTLIAYNLADPKQEMYAKQLVDVLDLDGDGQAEIVTQNRYYESWDYTIYRKSNTGRPSGWRRVFRGSGGGV
jgi:hypothetical protein